MSFGTPSAPRLWSAEEDPFERVLVVCAHPDDVDFGAAGTVGTLVGAGSEVHYCIVTNGEAGGSDRSQSRTEMAKVRQEEQRAAAAAVGVEDVHFLGYPDGQLIPSLELRRDISRVIRRCRPDLVISQSPERNWSIIFASHPDHLAAGEATVNAVYPDSRNPFAHPELLDEGLEPHTVRALWITTAPAANVAVDITDAFERKVEALRRHESQGTDNPGIRERILLWAQGSASTAGLAEGRLAELFWSVATG